MSERARRKVAGLPAIDLAADDDDDGDDELELAHTCSRVYRSERVQTNFSLFFSIRAASLGLAGWQVFGKLYG